MVVTYFLDARIPGNAATGKSWTVPLPDGGGAITCSRTTRCG